MTRGVQIANISKMRNAHIRIRCIVSIASCGHQIGTRVRERKMMGNEILLVYLCRRIFGLRKRFFKARVKS